MHFIPLTGLFCIFCDSDHDTVYVLGHEMVWAQLPEPSLNGSG